MWIDMDGLQKEHSGLCFWKQGGERHEEVLSTEDGTLHRRLLYKALGMALKCPLPCCPATVGIWGNVVLNRLGEPIPCSHSTELAEGSACGQC